MAPLPSPLCRAKYPNGCDEQKADMVSRFKAQNRAALNQEWNEKQR